MPPRKNLDENFQWFDDCVICQATKLAEEQGRSLTAEELRAAFLKAKEQGHMVGGSLIDGPEPERRDL